MGLGLPRSGWALGWAFGLGFLLAVESGSESGFLLAVESGFPLGSVGLAVLARGVWGVPPHLKALDSHAQDSDHP